MTQPEPIVTQMTDHGYQPELGDVTDPHKVTVTDPAVPALIVDLLSRHRYTGLTEADYHDHVERILTNTPGLTVVREARLTPTDRIDLLVNGTIGVEVKMQGTRAAIIRQLARYARTGQLTHLILASSKVMLVKNIPPLIQDVPVSTTVLRGQVV